MVRDNHRRGKNRGNWNSRNSSSNGENSNSNNYQNGSNSFNKNSKQEKNHPSFAQRTVTSAEIQKQAEAIRAFKTAVVKCAICGEQINDMASAINNRGDGNPVHFDCVLKQLSEQEKPGPNEKVTYIGNGKFAVLHFDNVHDMRHFSIVKEIEWEARDSERGEWRDTMASLYSQVK